METPGKDNRRGAYRAEMALPARLGRRNLDPGRWRRSTLLNLSASGALIASPDPVEVGAEVLVEIPLSGELASAAGTARLRLACEVVDASRDLPEGADADGRHAEATFLALQHLASEGESAYEAVRKAVFARQREVLARRSGADQGSPMVTSPEERAARRTTPTERFSDRSVGRPGSD